MNLCECGLGYGGKRMTCIVRVCVHVCMHVCAVCAVESVHAHNMYLQYINLFYVSVVVCMISRVYNVSRMCVSAYSTQYTVFVCGFL